MENADAAAIDWMRQFQRNPCPDRVVWRQEESAQGCHFYYLSIPANEARPGAEAIVERNGNTFTIVRNDYRTLYIDLNDRVANLYNPIVVMRDGQTLFNEKTPRNAGFIRQSTEERTDPNYIFSARLEVTADGVRRTPAPTYQ